MKTLFLILISFNLTLAQANLIQSIDFDSEGNVIYGLTGSYDYSSAVRYDGEIFESWNITEMYNLNFQFISTTVDDEDNIWVYYRDRLLKYANNNWEVFMLPSVPGAVKYSDLTYNNGNLWMTSYHGSMDSETGVWKFDADDNTWKEFNMNNSDYPSYCLTGRFFHKDDSTFVATSKGLLLIHNDSLEVLIDTSNSSINDEAFFTYFIDSNGKRWLGTFSQGLVRWNHDNSFTYFNTNNSDLPNNFVNAIDESSDGTLWIATDGGFASYKNGSITSYENLSSSSIVELSIDNQDRIWMGEVGTGRLLVFDHDQLNVVTEIEDQELLPDKFLLSQNYPNPFNPVTSIEYRVPSNNYVSLKIFDALGREVRTLVNEIKKPGKYSVKFDASQLSSGIYIYRLQSESFTKSMKMMLLK